jgi:phage/plasmid-associated DNA primase
MLGKKEAKKEVVVYKERNKLMNLPMNTIWEETKTDTGIQYTPLCTNCLVNPCKEHSDEKHSCLFINNDKSIVKSCYSCDSVIVADKKESKKIMTLFLNVKSNEETVYEELTYDILEIARENNYKREEGTGIVYEKVRSYAYKPYMEPLKFLNKIFLKSRKFKSNVNNMDNLIKYMKQYDEEDFPFMVRDPHYLGFRNGVLNTITCEFSEEPEDDDILVRKYFDYNFNYSTETPLMDKILDYQFTPDVRDFVYACLGRMFEIRDNYGFMLYLLGEAGCGKSLVIDVLCACFNKIGCINESYEIKYGIASLYDKDIIVCDDLPKNISQVFPQQTFQSCVTGGLVASAVKNKDAMEVQWKVPMLWAGNWFPDYLDKGQISRRLLTANFEKIVNNPDPSLKKRIIETELPALMYKCLLFYKKMIEHGNVEVWKFCPEYFVEQKEELRLERNPFFKFLLENSEYKEGNVVSMDELRDNFSNWLGKKVHKLDNGTIKQVNSDFEIVKIQHCKHCNKEHKRGCCEMYNSKDRTTKNVVRNIKLI